MGNKTFLSFATVSQALRTIPLPDIDGVVGIGRGGVVPASLLAYRLQCDLRIVHVNYRDDDHCPRYAQPQWLEGALSDLPAASRLLLVDDVAVSGKTLAFVASQLTGHIVTTLVLKGAADRVVFPEIATCVHWPWNAVSPVTYH